MKLYRLFLMVAAGGMLVSCGSKAPVKPVPAAFSLFETVLKDSAGLVRGADLGDDPEVVRQMEYDSALVVSNKYALIYDYKLPEERALNLKYTFGGNALQKIEMDVFLASEGQADTLTQDFKKYYSKKFGEPQQQMGVYVWMGLSQTGSNAVIEMKDESAEYGYGKLNITIYPKDFQSKPL